MRDINRIDTIMDKMNKLWKAHPDYRFWQIINIIAAEVVEIEPRRDVFFIEDGSWNLVLSKMLKERGVK